MNATADALIDIEMFHSPTAGVDANIHYAGYQPDVVQVGWMVRLF